MRLARVRVEDAAVEARLEGGIARWDGGEAPVAELTLLARRKALALSDRRATLLAPCRPTRIVCVGQNYRAHAAERGKPVPAEPNLFFKPPSAVVPPGGAILYPPWSSLLHFEAELAVVIGERGSVLGYTCFNDVTARDVQDRDNQWGRAKGFDGSACLGPWIETELDVRDVAVRSYLNGELRQDGRTSDFVFPAADLVDFISGVMTLRPGDVIATGTPAGVGELRVGDTIEVEVEGIGRLANRVDAKR